jgi:uncharacterized membrane protein (DUF2068 family)
MTSSGAVKTVALFEGLKGLLALLVATGLLTLLHKDLHEVAVRLVEHAHLNPAAKYPGIFLEAAERFRNSRVVLLALSAAAYSVLRGVEAYGLYRGRAWAEVLAAVSSAVYIPLELVRFHHHPTWVSFAFLAANALVVAIMVRVLFLRRMIA